MCLAWLALGLGHPVSAQSSNPVVIELQPTAQVVSQEIVRIGDVATIRGGTPVQRSKLGQIDIDSVPTDGSRPISVTARQIKYRLLLGGWSEDDFVVLGPNSTSVSYRATEKLYQGIADALTHSIAANFAQPVENFELQLDTSSLVNINDSDLELLPQQIHVAWGSEIPVGVKTVPIEFVDRSGARQRLSLRCTVSVMRDFVIANNNLSKGQVIQAGHVTRVRRPVSDRNAQLVSHEQVIGKIVARDIQQFETIRASHVKTDNQSITGNQVRRNSLVNAVIQKGSLNITIKNVRAMQSGIPGQRIEVVNPLNKRRMAAMVIDGQTVRLY